MAFKQLSDDDALALNGLTDSRTALEYPRILEALWGAGLLGGLHRFLTVFPADLRVLEIEGNADAIGILPGVCTIGGVLLEYAGSAGAAVIDGLPNNATTMVWATNNAGVIAFSSGAAWPGTTHLKLAKVTLAAGVITLNQDMRGAAMLSV